MFFVRTRTLTSDNTGFAFSDSTTIAMTSSLKNMKTFGYSCPLISGDALRTGIARAPTKNGSRWGREPLVEAELIPGQSFKR